MAQRNFPVYNRDIVVEGRGGWIDLVLTGDWHYGAAACDGDALRGGLNWLAQAKNTYWLGMGDLQDAIAFRDKRFDPRTLDPQIWDAVGRNIGHYHDEVKRRLRRMVRPAAHNCLGLIEGNHEAAALNLAHPISVLQSLVDDYRDWCVDRKKPLTPNPHFEQLGDCAAVVLRFRRKTGGADSKRPGARLVLFVSHGAGFASTIGGRANRLESVMAWLPDADVYACGHFHDRFVRPRPVLKIAHSETAPCVVPVDKMFCLVPSFMRTYHGEPNYASRRLYPPSVLGWLRLRIEPFAWQGRPDPKSRTRQIERPRVTCEVTI